MYTKSNFRTMQTGFAEVGSIGTVSSRQAGGLFESDRQRQDDSAFKLIQAVYYMLCQVSG
jgi:hypothetical protein